MHHRGDRRGPFGNGHKLRDVRRWGIRDLRRRSCLIGFVTFIAAVIASSWFKGFLKMIPVLIGIVVGYLVAVPFGYVDFTPVLEAAWIGLPSITLPPGA